jgi:hypothetical protein
VSEPNDHRSAKSLTQSDMLHAWIFPIAAALIVSAIMMIERLQVDWTADCTLSSNSDCDTDIFANLFAWLPAAFTYAIFHILGARRLIETSSPVKSALKRGVGIVVYAALQLLPVPGWYLFYAGVAGGILISLTVIGLLIAPLVGVLTAGFCAGLILAAFVGAPLLQMTGKQLWALFWNYGLGATFGTLILSLGQAAFDPAFIYLAQPQHPWLTILGALATILAVGIVMSWWGLRAWRRAGLVQYEQGLQIKDLSIVATLGALLILPSHILVQNKITVFGKDGERFPALAGVLRGNKPAIDTPFVLGGLNYVGQRRYVERREVVQRSRMQYTVLNKGQANEVTESATVYDSFVQWQMTDIASPPHEYILVTADQSSRMVEQECLSDATTVETFCVIPSPPYRDELKKAFAVAEDEDGFLLSEKAPDASLGVRIAAQTADVRDRKTWELIYCRLNLVNVTSAKFSASQIIPCNADWVSIANALRTRLEADFNVVQPKP